MLTAQLCNACRKRDFEHVSALLVQRGLNPNFPHSDKDKVTALHIAAENADAGLIQLLLEHNASVDVIDAYGFTPLSRGCITLGSISSRSELCQRLGTARLLVRDPSDLFTRDKFGNTPIHILASRGTIEAFEEYVSFVIDICGSGRPSLRLGIVRNLCLLPGWGYLTPVHFACEAGRVDIVEFILATIVGMEGIFEKKEVATTLHAVLYSVDATGWTPLHWAAKTGNGKLCLMLSDHGASSVATDYVCRTPLDVAFFNGHYFLRNLLEDSDLPTDSSSSSASSVSSVSHSQSSSSSATETSSYSTSSEDSDDSDLASSITTNCSGAVPESSTKSHPRPTRARNKLRCSVSFYSAAWVNFIGICCIEGVMRVAVLFLSLPSGLVAVGFSVAAALFPAAVSMFTLSIGKLTPIQVFEHGASKQVGIISGIVDFALILVVYCWSKMSLWPLERKLSSTLPAKERERVSHRQPEHSTSLIVRPYSGRSVAIELPRLVEMSARSESSKKQSGISWDEEKELSHDSGCEIQRSQVGVSAVGIKSDAGSSRNKILDGFRHLKNTVAACTGKQFAASGSVPCLSATDQWKAIYPVVCWASANEAKKNGESNPKVYDDIPIFLWFCQRVIWAIALNATLTENISSGGSSSSGIESDTTSESSVPTDQTSSDSDSTESSNSSQGGSDPVSSTSYSKESGTSDATYSMETNNSPRYSAADSESNFQSVDAESSIPDSTDSYRNSIISNSNSSGLVNHVKHIKSTNLLPRAASRARYWRQSPVHARDPSGMNMEFVECVPVVGDLFSKIPDSAIAQDMLEYESSSSGVEVVESVEDLSIEESLTESSEGITESDSSTFASSSTDMSNTGVPTDVLFYLMISIFKGGCIQDAAQLWRKEFLRVREHNGVFPLPLIKKHGTFSNSAAVTDLIESYDSSLGVEYVDAGSDLESGFLQTLLVQLDKAAVCRPFSPPPAPLTLQVSDSRNFNREGKELKVLFREGSTREVAIQNEPFQDGSWHALGSHATLHSQPPCNPGILLPAGEDIRLLLWTPITIDLAWSAVILVSILYLREGALLTDILTSLYCSIWAVHVLAVLASGANWNRSLRSKLSSARSKAIEFTRMNTTGSE